MSRVRKQEKEIPKYNRECNRGKIIFNLLSNAVIQKKNIFFQPTIYVFLIM